VCIGVDTSSIRCVGATMIKLEPRESYWTLTNSVT
jgi:hypothetical protein